MASHYKLCTPVPKDRKKPDGEVWWHRVGTAFYDPEKDRVSVILDSLPAPGARLLGFPEGEDNRGSGGRKSRRQPEPPPPDDDDIPF